jgi:hypothetical protein
MSTLGAVLTLLATRPSPPAPRGPAPADPAVLRLLVDYVQHQSYAGGTVESGPDDDALSAWNLALAAAHRALRRAADRV